MAMGFIDRCVRETLKYVRLDEDNFPAVFMVEETTPSRRDSSQDYTRTLKFSVESGKTGRIFAFNVLRTDDDESVADNYARAILDELDQYKNALKGNGCDITFRDRNLFSMGRKNRTMTMSEILQGC